MLGSIPFVYFFLWIYGYLGFLLSIIYGTLIGLLNGIVLGALIFYFPASSEAMHRRRMLGCSIIVSVVGTYVLFFPLTYPVFTIVPYPDYRTDVPPIAGYALCVSPFAFIAAFVASFASRRIRYRSDVPSS